MESDQLVLGTAVGYDWKRVATFVESLRATGYQGAVVLVVGDVDPLTRWLLSRRNVDLVAVDDHELLRRGLARVPGAEGMDPTTLDIQTARYVLYAGYLERHGEGVREVLLSDVRDVCFQAPPFEHEHELDTLSCAVEDGTIGACECNSGWVLERFGPEGLEQLAPRRISCSGTTLGSLAHVRAYLDEMIRLILEKPLPTNGIDQALHNFIVYTDRVQDLRLCTNEEGPFLTLHEAEGWRVGPTGDILAPGGTIAPIVHQYDRHAATAAAVERRYRTGRVVSRLLKWIRRHRRRRARVRA